MENRSEQELRLQQLRFIGKIIAGFTHEIKNHIAIIKESAGLIGDLIRFGKEESNNPLQYLEIITSVEDQIVKTLDLFKYLNRFAHRMDTPHTAFNVNENLEELIALLDRFAHQRKISFEKDFQDDVPSLINDPALFQFLVFCFVEEKLTRLDKNSSLILRTALLDKGISVSIIAKGDYIEPDKELSSYEMHDYVIKQLGGNLVRGEKETVITLPVLMT